MGSPDAREHGGPRGAELLQLGLSPDTIIDFSVNTNVYGPCPEVARAIREAVLDRYPDPAAWAARQRLASFLDLSPAEVLLGNGAADLLWTIVRWASRSETKALIVEPTFCEFRAACAAAGIHATEWRAPEATGFAIDLEEVARRARQDEARLVYLCSPNTPTGVCVPAARLAAWAAAGRELRIIVDQSFLSLSERAADHHVPMPENVVRVRSLTKDHAIPGVRIGYAIAPADLVRALERQQPAWNVSSLAQAAVTAACDHAGFVEQSRRRSLDDRDELRRALATVSVPTLSSSTIFVLARVGAATALRLGLLSRHAILVRDCTSFGLPAFVRLAARPQADVAALVRALGEERARGFPC